MPQMMGVFAEFERAMIQERVRAGGTGHQVRPPVYPQLPGVFRHGGTGGQERQRRDDGTGAHLLRHLLTLAVGQPA